jgi:hypothetical protein
VASSLNVDVRALRIACRAALAAALLVGLPAVAKEPASPPTPAPAPPAPAQTAPAAPATDPMAIQQELVQIQQRLVAAEQEAMKDPALKALQADLQQQIEREMAEVEPTYEAKIERIDEIRTRLDQSQQAGDQAAVEQLITEGTKLQRELEAAQGKVLEDEQVAAKVAQFEEKLHAQMLEVEPETDKLVERANALVAKLQRSTTPTP